MQQFEDELFGTIAPPLPAPEGSNILKAAFFTLIVVVHGMEKIERCQNFVSLISKKFPCKIIFIAIDTDTQETFVHHTLSTRIVGSGSSGIACDVLAITASQDQVQRVPFLVIPEILADLPAFLLVGHEPTESKTLVDQLEPYVNRIVFDVLRLTDVGRFAEQILGLPKREKFVDLNWARTKPWREALFRTFNSKEALDHLASCNRVEIRYCHRPSPNHFPDTQALLLQAWIASRLGWQLSSIEDAPDHAVVHYSSGTREILMVLTPTDSSVVDDGTVVSVEIMGEHDIHYLLAHERDDRHISIHSSTQERCEMPYSLFVGSFHRGRALLSEAFLQTASPSYMPALELLASRPWRRER